MSDPATEQMREAIRQRDEARELYTRVLRANGEAEAARKAAESKLSECEKAGNELARLLQPKGQYHWRELDARIRSAVERWHVAIRQAGKEEAS